MATIHREPNATILELGPSYPSLDLATVYATLAYVLAHRAQIDEYVAQRRRGTEELRAEIERRFPQDGIRARLMARRTGMSSG